MPKRQDALHAVRTLLEYIEGVEDGELRPDLLETPERVVRAWEQTWGEGYRTEPSLITLFDRPHHYDQMVVVRRIALFSTCEHHMAPFYGYASVGYLAGHRGIVGLSKLARVVDHFSRRLQVQERLTQEIANYLFARLGARGVGVVVEAAHMCMITRGVEKSEAKTVTSALLGCFQEPGVKQEFLSLIERG